jgi:transposase
LVDPILKKMSPQFEKMYAEKGRPSIPPEYLLRASLVQILYTIRSERLLMEELDYNLLFRWFVGLSMDDAVWNHLGYYSNARYYADMGQRRGGNARPCLIASVT